MFCLYLTTGGCYIKLEVIDSSGRNFCPRDFLLIQSLADSWRETQHGSLSFRLQLMGSTRKPADQGGGHVTEKRHKSLFVPHRLNTQTSLYIFICAWDEALTD